MPDKKTIKSALESMMFVWGEPLDVKIVASLFEIEKIEASSYFQELKREYDEDERGIRIREIDGKYQFVTDEANFEYLQTICTPVKERRLSQAALEVLAIVAYNQPVAKSEIDSIRGIKSDRVLEGLTRRGLVEDQGRSDAIGRPVLYGTTDAFLTYFDLTTIKDLPDIEDIGEIIQFEGNLYPDENETLVEIEEDSLEEIVDVPQTEEIEF